MSFIDIRSNMRVAAEKVFFIYCLCNMKGQDQQYNGTQVELVPQRNKKTGHVEYGVMDPTTKERIRSRRPPYKLLVVGKNQVENSSIIPEARQSRAMLYDGTTGSGGLSNTSSSKLAFNNVSAQLRTRAKVNMHRQRLPSLQAALVQMFEEFDEDGSGNIDEEELHYGLTEIAGVNVSRYETSLLFPLFDDDGNGTVEVDEFFNAILGDSVHSMGPGGGTSIHGRKLSIVKRAHKAGKKAREVRLETRTQAGVESRRQAKFNIANQRVVALKRQRKARKQLIAGRPEWARGNKRFLKMEKRLAFDVRSPDIARMGGRARRVLEEDTK